MAAGNTLTIVDSHCHVISPDRAKYPLAPLGGKQSDWSSERPTPPEKLLTAMDDAGVAKAVVVQASTAYGHDASYLADSLKRFPARLTGVFSVGPLDPKALEQMDRWTGLGMTGLRVFTTGSTMPGQQTWLDDERAYPVWDKAGKLKLPVAVQMTPDGIPLLLKIVKAFPGTNFLLDHLARSKFNDGPPYAGAAGLWDLAQYKNIYVKLTSRTVENCQEGKATPETFMPKLMSTFGSDHVLWGSNFPAHDDTLANIVKETLHVLAPVSDADRANIMGGTALRLYPALK